MTTPEDPIKPTDFNRPVGPHGEQLPMSNEERIFQRDMNMARIYGGGPDKIAENIRLVGTGKREEEGGPGAIFSSDGILLLSGDGESGIGNVIANWLQAQINHRVERATKELNAHHEAEIKKRLKNLQNTVESYKTRLEATQLSLGKAYHQSLQAKAETWLRAAETLEAVYSGSQAALAAAADFRAKAQDTAPKSGPSTDQETDRLQAVSETWQAAADMLKGSREPDFQNAISVFEERAAKGISTPPDNLQTVSTEDEDRPLKSPDDKPQTKKRAGVPLFSRRRTQEDLTLFPGEPENEPDPLFDLPAEPARFAVVDGQVDWQYFTHVGSQNNERCWVNSRGDWYSWDEVYDQCRKRPDGSPVILSHPLTLAAPTQSGFSIEEWGKLKAQAIELVALGKKMGII